MHPSVVVVEENDATCTTTTDRTTINKFPTLTFASTPTSIDREGGSSRFILVHVRHHCHRRRRDMSQAAAIELRSFVRATDEAVHRWSDANKENLLPLTVEHARQLTSARLRIAGGAGEFYPWLARNGDNVFVRPAAAV